MSPIGFVGLGIMGEGMAGRLLSEGVAGSDDKPLVIWNRSSSKCTALAEQFADKKIEIKETPREVVEACGITYSMLSTPEASKIVFEGDDGVLAGVSAGKSIVDCATLAETDMQRMNEEVVSKGGYVSMVSASKRPWAQSHWFCFLHCIDRRFLEAPVSGSKVPAATGTLIFLCAGSKDLFDEIEDTGLKAMGKASHFFGPEVGAGTRAKLVVNSLMGTMLSAFGEALALSESVGLDPNKMIEVIEQGAVQSPMFSLKGPKMIEKDHEPNFPLKHAHKDMSLACDMAKAAGVEFSVMESAEKLYREAKEDLDLKIANEDFSAIFEKVHKDSTSDYSKKRMHDT